MTGRTTRADRLAHPTTRDAVRALAETHGACLHPGPAGHAWQRLAAPGECLLSSRSRARIALGRTATPNPACRLVPRRAGLRMGRAHLRRET
jgi:hypothetical protein